MSLLEQDGRSGPRMSWSFPSSWEEPVSAAKPTRTLPSSPSWGCAAAPPCSSLQWEGFCHRSDGKETRDSSRMESLILNEGITQISKSYRPWNKLLFLAFFLSCWSILVCEKAIPKAAIVKSFNPFNSYLPFFCPNLKLLTLVMAAALRNLHSLYDQCRWKSEHITPLLVGAWGVLFGQTPALQILMSADRDILELITRGMNGSFKLSTHKLLSKVAHFITLLCLSSCKAIFPS